MDFRLAASVSSFASIFSGRRRAKKRQREQLERARHERVGDGKSPETFFRVRSRLVSGQGKGPAASRPKRGRWRKRLRTSPEPQRVGPDKRRNRQRNARRQRGLAADPAGQPRPSRRRPALRRQGLCPATFTDNMGAFAEMGPLARRRGAVPERGHGRVRRLRIRDRRRPAPPIHAPTVPPDARTARSSAPARDRAAFRSSAGSPPSARDANECRRSCSRTSARAIFFRSRSQ